MMHPPSRPAGPPALPFLEHYPEPGGAAQRIPLDPVPFRLGRGPASHFLIHSRQVSKDHAEVFRVGAQYRLRDLNSTNGTFVNGQRLSEAALADGDIVHIAHKEFRFGHDSACGADTFAESRTEQARDKLPPSLIRAATHLHEMLASYCCSIHFQPIVCTTTQAPLGYEALGRGNHDQLSTNPAELFRLAEQCGLAADLSRMFRTVAVEEAAFLTEPAHVFLNLHPQEMDTPALFDSLRDVRAIANPAQRLVLEVSESVVADPADPASLRRLRAELTALDIGLAYDDFGAGQARLRELIEVPPDFVKLDMRLIRGIHRDAHRQQLVQALTQVIAGLGVQVIAEGVELAEEAEVCARLGCQYSQGFLFGRPQALPPTTLSGRPSSWKIYGPTGIRPA